jgi:hypothetical protein
MGFVSSIIVVEDVPHSRGLYEGILHMKVSGDFGIYNVGFEGGLSLYRKAFFQELIGAQADLGRHHNVVLYFEVERLEELQEAVARNGFQFVHRIREQPWKQRTFRFYDYDNHILEIAEPMDVVLRRLQREGHTIEEIAGFTGYPSDQVVRELEKHTRTG